MPSSSSVVMIAASLLPNLLFLLLASCFFQSFCTVTATTATAITTHAATGSAASTNSGVSLEPRFGSLFDAVLMNNTEVLQIMLDQIKQYSDSYRDSSSNSNSDRDENSNNTNNNNNSIFNTYINTKSELGSPLMVATLMGFTEITKLLLQSGADVTTIDNNGYTPIDGAAFKGHNEVIKVLLQYGANPNILHKDGYYPIHRACWGESDSHTKSVLALLETGLVDPLVRSIPTPAVPEATTCLEYFGNIHTYTLVRGWHDHMNMITEQKMQLEELKKKHEILKIENEHLIDEQQFHTVQEGSVEIFKKLNEMEENMDEVEMEVEA